jgi:23S rRNA pseudouridine2605 synthase
VRLNQFLARAGLGSRRACEDLVRDGRVTINGRKITQLATRVEAGDAVCVDRKKIEVERPLTAILHKPAGYLCSTIPEGGSKTIYELLPRGWPRVFSIGRLDKESEGLLLVTNDGELSQRLTHPSYKLPKTYEVVLDREFDFAQGEKLRKGFLIEGGRGKFDAIYRLGPRVIKVVLTQGLKRQIRLMLEKLGYKVHRLVRVRIGGLELDDLQPGCHRILNEKEIHRYFGPATGGQKIDRAKKS